MQITLARLQQYRSYERLVWKPAQGLCVLLGENAAGKTNVLEALFLCALGRSHRTRHDAELIRYEQESAYVGLELSKRTGSHKIECRLFREGRREIKVDDMPLSRSGELLGTLHVVMFSPEDLRLIKQGPAERRRFMDMELSQLQPAYYYRLQQYNLALKQRNALLRNPSVTPALLAPWDEQLSILGAGLIHARAEFMEKLAALAGDLHRELSGGETLRIAYEPAFEPGNVQRTAERMQQGLFASLERDIRTGATQQGPHRDDIRMELNGADARAYGSQGQQRTAALALKLSELALMKELGGEPPVLLLDDVLSELDGTRQTMLARAMRDSQTFLTCTQLAGLADAGITDMTVYRVADGTVTKADTGNT
ncbi:MAG TPA: DNA replication/repair protein RecF [Feifaniaceae bacterium]|nr:DNA replication/repair protein RecF [Feifaniaceae bacterium]